MTSVVAWANGVKAQNNGDFVAIHLELMVSREQFDSVKKLLAQGRENTQHPIWLSDVGPAPSLAEAIAPDPVPIPMAAPAPLEGWGRLVSA